MRRGGVEQVELVVDAAVAALLFVADEREGVAGAGEEVQFAWRTSSLSR